MGAECFFVVMGAGRPSEAIGFTSEAIDFNYFNCLIVGLSLQWLQLLDCKT
jgi:hypothetical protein